MNRRLELNCQAELRAVLTVKVMNFKVSRVGLVISFSAATFSCSCVGAEADWLRVEHDRFVAVPSERGKHK